MTMCIVGAIIVNLDSSSTTCMYHQTNNTNHVFMNKLLKVKWLGMLPSV